MGSLLRPDDLTRRERAVLDLIRLGLTNEEIAGRLGISLDGAKYHVSQILSKLGVGSREEAAALAPAEARPWWMRAVGWGLAAKLAGAAVVLAAAAGIGVLVWAVIATGGAGNEEAQTQSLSGPHIGDHWHATLNILIGDGELPPIAWLDQSGLGHGPDWVDGILHIIPQTAVQEGEGSSLGRLFERAGGALSEDELRLPGGETYRPDGSHAVLQVYLNGQPLADWITYIPQDGDRIRIVFGPPERSSPAVVAATPVPWVDSTPGPTPSRAPFSTPNPADLAVPPCRAEDLEGTHDGGNGAGGWAFMYFAFTNVSRESCRLEGVPAIQFLDADGQAEPTTWREDPCIIPSIVAPCPHLVAILQPDTGQTPLPNSRLKPGQAALSLMFWGRLSDIPSYTPCPLSASAIAFDLPGDGGRVIVPFDSPMNACYSPGVSQFGPAPTPTPVPGARPQLTARLELPDTVVAGSPLRFVADLTNESTAAPFVFGDLCPAYTVILGEKQAQEWHSLNCKPVVSIGPGQTVSFAMELAIPKDIAPGSYFLDWTTSGGTYVAFAGAGSASEKTPYKVTVVAP